MSEKEPDIFEDPLGDEDDDDEAIEALVNDVEPATGRPTTPAAPPARRDTPPTSPATPPAQPPAAGAEPSPESTGPVFSREGLEEVIEKKGDIEYSNFTIKQAFEAGSLKEGRHYQTGGLASALGLVYVKLRAHDIERMRTDATYREKVFKDGP